MMTFLKFRAICFKHFVFQIFLMHFIFCLKILKEKTISCFYFRSEENGNHVDYLLSYAQSEVLANVGKICFFTEKI